jgi:DHA2 family multidrug resistance protein
MIALIVWELHPANRSPVVNLRVYGNRTLSAAALISFVLGVGIYAVNFAFAVFIENVLGLTSINSGIALLPLGLGAVPGLAIIAVINDKVDHRALLTAGLAIGAIGCWTLGLSTLFTGIEDTWLPLALVGLGFGVSVMTATIVAFAALRPSEAADGAAQLGLTRQLGGSFGIALLTTYITRMADVHRASLVQNASAANQTFRSSAQGLTRLIVMHGYSWPQAQHMAIGLVSRAIDQQAALKGFNCGFQAVALMFLACVFLVPLLKEPTPGSETAIH